MTDGTFTVDLQFADGVTRRIEARPEQSVLEAGLAAGVPLLHQCQSGSCASCLAQLTAGQAPMRSDASSTLLRSEAEAGKRLLCLSQARSDCAFALNYESDAAGATRKALAFVDAVERLGPDVVRLSLELAEGSWIDFKPGQFVQVAVPGAGVARSYSPATPPSSLPRLDLLIRLLDGGAMSNWLTQHAKRDDVIELEGPFGGFFLRESLRAPHILVAGGTGLAPMLSILDALRERPGRKPSILLSFGCASPDALFCLDDLALRRHWLPSLETRISVDRGCAEGLLIGTPVSALRPEDVSDPQTVAYLCGPPPMIEAAQQRLAALGLRPERIFAEQFVPSH